MLSQFVQAKRATRWLLPSSYSLLASLILAFLFTDAQPAYTFPLSEPASVRAIPAFARKYGLPCSACHTAWPELNNFGQVFRDNGYQLDNERDSPIWQNPSYFPITFRMTPNWHREQTNQQPIDSIPGGGAGSSLIDGTVSQHGFDLSGMDLWTAGTLFKNISFSLLPSSNSTGAFHFENAFVRFDNLFKSSWVNLKFGKFELDNLISEKRFLFLSANGGLYQLYHFVPFGDTNDFGLGDNQLGMALEGHSINSYTRYSVALLSSNSGNVGLPTNRGYDTYLTFSQAFQAGSMGLQRIGGYAYIGQRPTYSMTTGGVPIPGTGIGNASFYRAGFSGDLFLGKFEFLPFYMHGHDSAFLGTATPSNQPLPAGALAPSWNGGFVETHYYYSPQLVFTQRWEIIRMAQQALPTTPSTQGNTDAYSIGFRWYPIMFSRAGLAWHNEFSIVKSVGVVPLSGNGIGVPPTSPTAGVWSNSLFTGLDFDF
jgi:hypothetical protein